MVFYGAELKKRNWARARTRLDWVTHFRNRDLGGLCQFANCK